MKKLLLILTLMFVMLMSFAFGVEPSAYFKMDDSSAPVVDQIFGNNCSVSASVVTYEESGATANTGTSISTTGASGAIDCAIQPYYKYGNMTYNGWFKLPTTTTRNNLYRIQADGIGNMLVKVDVESSNVIRFQDAGSTYSTTQTISDNTWFMLTIWANDTGIYSQINNNSIETLKGSAWSRTGIGNSFPLDIIQQEGNTRFVDNFYIFNYTIDATERETLWNDGLGYIYSIPVDDIATLTATDLYSGSSINTFNATINDNATIFTTTNGTIYINVTASGYNSSLLQNFTFFADGYFSKTEQDQNITSTINSNIHQSNTSITLTQIYTDTNINTFNITDDYGTLYQTTNGSIEILGIAGVMNFTLNADSYLEKNVSYNASALSSNLVNFDMYQTLLNVSAQREQNTSIKLTDFNLTFNPNGTSQDYTTTNGSIYVPVMNGTNYTFTLSAEGYFDANPSILIDTLVAQDEVVNISKEGLVLFTFRDSDTNNIINSSLVLELEDEDSLDTYNVTGGTQLVDNLVNGVDFTLFFYGSGYQTNSYYFTYANQSAIDLYLINGTDNITYTLYDTASSPLQDVEITIEKFINGGWTQISSQLTDVTGRAVFGLERGISHRITFNKDGYISQVDINRFSETSFSVVLESQNVFDFDKGYRSILVEVYPTGTQLNATTINFNATISSNEGLLEYSRLKLFYNGTLLASDNSTSNSGATLQFNYDLSSYNDTFVMLQWSYKLLNNSEESISSRVFKVSDLFYYQGTLLELKDRLDDKLSIGEKIALYALVFFVTLIMVSIFATGLPAVVVALAFATLAGWVFGINILLLLFITGTIIAFTIAFTGDNI